MNMYDHRWNAVVKIATEMNELINISTRKVYAPAAVGGELLKVYISSSEKIVYADTSTKTICLYEYRGLNSKCRVKEIVSMFAKWTFSDNSVEHCIPYKVIGDINPFWEKMVNVADRIKDICDIYLILDSKGDRINSETIEIDDDEIRYGSDHTCYKYDSDITNISNYLDDKFKDWIVLLDSSTKCC